MNPGSPNDVQRHPLRMVDPALRWIDDLPTLRLTEREFKELGEYSCSYPTGTVIGKRWKRLVGAFDRKLEARGGKPRWVVCEYVEHTDPALVAIRDYRPIIICSRQSVIPPSSKVCQRCGRIAALEEFLKACSHSECPVVCVASERTVRTWSPADTRRPRKHPKP